MPLFIVGSTVSIRSTNGFPLTMFWSFQVLECCSLKHRLFHVTEGCDRWTLLVGLIQVWNIFDSLKKMMWRRNVCLNEMITLKHDTEYFSNLMKQVSWYICKESFIFIGLIFLINIQVKGRIILLMCILWICSRIQFSFNSRV